MSAVMNLRKTQGEAFMQKNGVKLGFMSFFIKATVAALKAIPQVSAQIDGEDLVYPASIDIGVAVSTERGLMVPVLRNCEKKSFAELEKELADLATKARDGKISLDALQGGCFTITNGGVFGSLVSTPIINAPQSAILGMHAIKERPVVENGQIVARPMMYLALSYDHRVVDGKEAVTTLVTMKQVLEKPVELLGFAV
jgi:2-oxoglutarate dehydrogenase E2 component (dihydrolipoamide succinyltransferase)